jgi:hypothetical protein
MPLSFAITWDYRCPFVATFTIRGQGLLVGPIGRVTFVPFSLGQIARGRGETDVWVEPGATAASWRCERRGRPGSVS